VDRNKIDRNKHKLDWYIMAILYPTYENVKKGLRSVRYDPDSLSDDDIEDFMDRMRLPGAKYAFMSMLLAGDYSFLNPSDNVGDRLT
jgi:hypothetical protein